MNDPQRVRIKMIKTAIFDLGDVFVNVETGRPVMGLRERFPGISEEKIRESAYRSGMTRRFELGDVDGHTFYHYFRKALGEDFSYDFFEKTWQEMFTPIQPMIDLLPELKKRFRLVVLSNTDALHIAYIDRAYGFLHHFDSHVYSYEVGLLKPDPAIYRIALERSDTAPHEAVYIDDKLENVQTAMNLSMEGIHFKGYDAFIREWESRFGQVL